MTFSINDSENNNILYQVPLCWVLQFFVMLNVFRLSVVMLSVVMLSVIMLSVVMLSVVAPKNLRDILVIVGER